MTEKQKKIAIIAGVVIIALLLLLSGRRAAGNTIVNQQGVPDIQVTIPSMNIPERGPFAITIPGLPSFTPYQYSAISPCMCNGAATSAQQQSGMALTFVTNAGGAGTNVYNYYPPQQQSGLNSLTGIQFVSR
jgi:hypothetical protein